MLLLILTHLAYGVNAEKCDILSIESARKVRAMKGHLLLENDVIHGVRRYNVRRYNYTLTHATQSKYWRKFFIAMAER